MALVRDASNDNLKVYFNEELVGNYDGFFENTDTIDAKEILIGNDRNCEGGCIDITRQVQGSFSSVKIYDRALDF